MTKFENPHVIDPDAAASWTVTTSAEQAWLHPVPGERMLILVRGSDVGGTCTVI